jgi:hypothetical protein
MASKGPASRQGGAGLVADRGHAVLALGPLALRGRRDAGRADRRRSGGVELRRGTRSRRVASAGGVSPERSPPVRGPRRAAEEWPRPGSRPRLVPVVAEPDRRLSELFALDRSRIEGTTGRRAGSALRVHEALKARPLRSITDLAATTGLSYPVAAAGVDALVELGVAREFTGRRRDRLFVYERYVAVVGEGIGGGGGSVTGLRRPLRTRAAVVGARSFALAVVGGVLLLLLREVCDGPADGVGGRGSAARLPLRSRPGRPGRTRCG